MWRNSLFYSTVETVSIVLLFDDMGQILSTHTKEMKGKEFTELLPFLDTAVASVGWSSLGEISHVCWPHSFTGGRISSLTGTSLARAHGLSLKEITIFEYLLAQGNTFPMYLEANANEAISQSYEGGPLQIISIEEIPKGRHTGVGGKDFGNDQFQLYSTKDISRLWPYLQTKKVIPKLETLYLKRPNITLPPAPHGS